MNPAAEWPEFMLLAGAAITLAIAAEGCSVRPLAPASHPAADSVAVLLCANGLPCCNAFAVQPTGAEIPVLVTAAHCLPDLAVGDLVHYVTRQEWLHTARLSSEARIAAIDVFDRAVLLPAASDMPPLQLGIPDPAAPLTAISALYDWHLVRGYAEGSVWSDIGSSWLTTLDITFGWSGSPVLGPDGRVIGIVRACQTSEPGACDSHAGIMVTLSGMPLRQ